MKRINFIALILFLYSSNALSVQDEKISVYSPNNDLRFSIGIEGKDSCLVYQVFFKDKEVILKSKLGLDTSPKGFEANTWNNKLSVLECDTSDHYEIWNPVYGERKQILNHYNQIVFTLSSNNRIRGIMNLVVRVYNEGVAFRYHFPKGHNGGGHIRIADDLTEFTLPNNTMGYFTSKAQGEYSFLRLDEWAGEIERPLTLELPVGLYVSLTEAEAVNFCRTNFKVDEINKNRIICSMYDAVDAMEPFETPWRVIMIAETPGELLENNFIVQNLNPDNKIKKTTWIKPGKVMREITLSTEGAKRLVDFAVQQNIQFIHFDAGWYGNEFDYTQDATTVTVDPNRNPKGNLNLLEAIVYAKSKGIGVILYVNQRALANQLEELLPLYKSWGVAGIKFGFVQVGSYYWTKWLHAAIKKCASYELMVNVHDDYRPTGFSRTYPNLMTQEGIRGNEEMPGAIHNTVLPFTRFIAGAADYTFCYYYRKELGHKERHIKNTSAHQLALPIIYFSPWQYIYWYDKPDDYEGEPELEFWKQMPTTWDDTKVINGKIGEFVTVARKNADEWFVGSITNTETKKITIPLSFLDENKNYEATIYYDDSSIQTRTKVGITKRYVDSKTQIDEKINPSGGIAIHIKPLN